MRRSAWLAAALLCILTVVAVACSDATGPGENALRLAKHFDSLWSAADSQSASSHGNAVRASALTALETPVAYGADPTDITVSTAAGTERWKGVILASAPTGASGQPVTLLTYRELDAHTLLLVSLQPDGDASATMITNDSVIVLATAGSGAAAKRSLDRECTSATALANPGVALPSPTRFTCKVGRFTVQLALIFPSATGVDPALRNIFVAETTVNGVELAALSGQGVPRVQ
jgi:hypothetical protein